MPTKLDARSSYQITRNPLRAGGACGGDRQPNQGGSLGGNDRVKGGQGADEIDAGSGDDSVKGKGHEKDPEPTPISPVPVTA